MQTVAIIFAPIIGCWDAWRLLALRLDSGFEVVPLLLVLAAASVPLARRVHMSAAPFPIPLPYVSAMLLLYAAATLFAPPLMHIAVAALLLLGALHQAGIGRRPGAPFLALVLLALPVLPSFESFLAHPLWVASAGITALLLRMIGFQVAVQGVALRWGNALVQFDAACSGVRMLWRGGPQSSPVRWR